MNLEEDEEPNDPMEDVFDEHLAFIVENFGEYSELFFKNPDFDEKIRFAYNEYILKKYFLSSNDHALVIKFYRDAKRLHDSGEYNSSLLNSFISIEKFFKDLILVPVIKESFFFGSLESDILVDASFSSNSIERLSNIILSVIDQFGLDLKKEKRENSNKAVWDEYKEIKSLRNRLVHAGQDINSNTSQLGIDLCLYLIGTVFNILLKRLNLSLANDLSTITEVSHKSLNSNVVENQYVADFLKALDNLKAQDDSLGR